jgi:lysophospholipase L1-like esterase
MAGVDLIVIGTGMNDMTQAGANLGTINDSPSSDPSASLHAWIKNVIVAFDTAAPSKRKIWVGPPQNVRGANSLAASTAIQQECALASWPYVDSWHLSGINPTTWPTDLQTDQVHPLAGGPGGPKLGLLWARQFLLYSPY